MSVIILVLFFIVSGLLIWRKPTYMLAPYFFLTSFLIFGFTQNVANQLISPSWVFIAMVWTLFVLKYRQQCNFKLLIRNRVFFISYISLLILPPLFTYLVWGYVTSYFFVPHILALWGAVVYMIPDQEFDFDDLLKSLVVTAIALLVLYYPQSLIYYLETEGRGFGRERSDILLGLYCQESFTFCPTLDNIWFKMSLFGSYIFSIVLAVLMTVLLFKFINDPRKRGYFYYFVAFELIWYFLYINQYLTQLLVLAINIFVFIFMLMFLPKVKTGALRKSVFAITILLATTTVSFLSPLGSTQSASIFRINTQLKIAAVKSQVDYYDKKVNRISMVATALSLLAENEKLLSGTGEPRENEAQTETTTNKQVFLHTNHSDLFDYLIIYGFIAGTLPWIYYFFPILIIFIYFNRIKPIKAMVFLNVFITIYLLAITGNFAKENSAIAIHIIFFILFLKSTGISLNRNLFSRSREVINGS